MPKAKICNGDISNGLVEPLLENKYDAIIANYSLHHLIDSEKVIFLKTLLTKLFEGGVIYIGDVAFEARSEHDKCMKQVGDAWDKDEFVSMQVLYRICKNLDVDFKDIIAMEKKEGME